MAAPLLATLLVFGIYACGGLWFLYLVFQANSRVERILLGGALIYLAAFLATGVALVAGVIEQPGWLQSLSAGQRDQISDFQQYLVFSGAAFTLLFGAVGANTFSAGLTPSDALNISDRLSRLEEQAKLTLQRVEDVDRKINFTAGLHVLTLVVVLITLFGIYAC